jgi:ABC-type phosphate/phosphonate transport system substrate-binding protein
VGTFTVATAHAQDAAYRSVLIARSPGDPTDFVGAVAAVNDLHSMSGWISLVGAVHGPGAAWHGEVVTTGGHVASLRALRQGRAEIAAIDGVTLWHVQRLMPELLDGLFEVGVGPLIPCLPLITAAATSDRQLDQLRDALDDAVLDTLVEPAARALCINGFAPVDLQHYLPVLDLAPAPR